MKKEKSNSGLTIALALVLTGMVAFSGIMSTTVTKLTRQSTVESTQTIAQSQLSAVEEFVKKQEDRLMDYSKSNEIKEMLLALRDYENAVGSAKVEYKKTFEEKQKIVQKFMEDVSIANDEGIYVSKWSTEVLAHTNQTTVGKITREAGSQSLLDLQNALTDAGNKRVYNTGIILSPVGTHEQIVSLYKGIFDDNGQPIGLVGMGVYTEDLEKTLGFEITGLPNAKFLMVNTSDGKYIFNQGETIKTITKDGEDEIHEYKTTDNEKLLSLCENYRESSLSDEVGEYEFGDTVAVYAYSKNYGWVFQIEDNKAEMYAAASRIHTFMIIFIIAIFLAASIVFIINRKMVATAAALSKTIEKQEKTRKALDASMERDVLTQAKSRLSFIEEFSQLKENTGSVYFVLHSFHELCDININLGIDKADNYILEFTHLLNTVYGDNNVYRTSNKEYVCVMYGNNISSKEVMSRVRELHNNLSSPRRLTDGSIVNPPVDSVIVKQTSSNNLNVLPVLKDLAKKNRPIYANTLPFVDLDEQ